VAELESWRADLEDRVAETNSANYLKTAKDDENFSFLKKLCEVEFEEAQRQYKINDNRDIEYRNEFEEQADFGYDLDNKITILNELLEATRARLVEQSDEKFLRMTVQ
jgi:hypothetical protein